MRCSHYGPCALDGTAMLLGTSYLKSHGTFVKTKRAKSVNLKTLCITIISSSLYLIEKTKMD